MLKQSHLSFFFACWLVADRLLLYFDFKNQNLGGNQEELETFGRTWTPAQGLVTSQAVFHIGWSISTKFDFLSNNIQYIPTCRWNPNDAELLADYGDYQLRKSNHSLKSQSGVYTEGVG